MVKRENYQSGYTPIKIEAEPSKGGYYGDWFRESGRKPSCRIFIDNKPLSSFVKPTGAYTFSETDPEEVDRFFKEVILGKMDLDAKQKAKWLTYLQDTFHQGLFLYPVSSAIADTLGKIFYDEVTERDGTLCNYPTVGLDQESVDTQIYITTTTTGFAVQEFCKIRKLHTTDSTYGHKEQLNFVVPDPGQDYVIKAQATVTVSLTGENPKVGCTGDTISYGNQKIKAGFDNRSLLQILYDFIQRALGKYSIKVPDDNTPDDEPDEHSSFIPRNR